MSGTHQLLIDISALRPIHATAEFADEARRDAQRYTQADVGKVVKVLSPLKWWLIISVARGAATFRELAADLVSVEASEVANDSAVAGTTVQAALDTLSTKVAGLGSASGVTNDSAVQGATVKDALDSLSGLLGFGAVSSVFGRTGAVTAHSGDYTAAQVGAPPVARTITAGTGLTGGGDMTANRTLSADFGTSAGKVCQGNDARLSDARAPLAHGLTHLPGGPDALACGPASSLSVGGSNSEGSAMAFARQDHAHALPPFGSAAGTFCQGNDPRLNDARTPVAHALTHLPGGPDGLASGPASTLNVGGSNGEGIANAFARQDHTHALAPFGSAGGTFCEGNDARLSDARAPIAHALTHLPGGPDGLASGPASTLNVGGSNAEGSASAFARQDHLHALPPFGTTSSTFCEGSDARLSDARAPLAHALTHLPGGPDGLASGPASSLSAGGSNAEGSANAFARQDHIHALPPFGGAGGTFCEGNDARLNDARTPLAHALTHLPGGPDGLASGTASSLNVGGSNGEGVANAFARQDHTHALPPFGSTNGTFCEGGDARLSDARTPTAHALTHLPGGADGLASGPASSLSAGGSNAEGSANAFARQDHIHALPPFGTTSSTFCEGSDARLSDARTPIAHALTHAPGAPDGLAVGAPVNIGTANDTGTAAAYARADHVHDGSALVARDGSRPLTGALDAGGFNINNVGAVLEAPSSFAWVANAATIDVSAKNDFCPSGALTGNSTITLSNGVDGCQGTVYVKQDATGSRGLGFVVPGRTILREAGALDSNPQASPNTVTGYAYDFKTIAGTAYVIVARFFLS